jgi:enoyl-CoA hydratase/carnithine racemase
MPTTSDLRDLVHCRHEDGLAWLEIHRPEKLNALNGDTLVALIGAVERCSDDPAVRVILLTGAGDRAFAAGADIEEMSGLDTYGIRLAMEAGKLATEALESAAQPVLAVVNGYALGGGCELALACDLILASDKAQFGLPELSLGIIPGWGGTQRLERRIGYGRARDMIFTGRRILAEEALTWGLADRVYTHDTLRNEATALARTLATKAPAALAASKRALREGADLPLAEGLKLETEIFSRLWEREERVAAMSAFLKR